jgi:hypothetical protein
MALTIATVDDVSNEARRSLMARAVVPPASAPLELACGREHRRIAALLLGTASELASGAGGRIRGPSA